ncbi:hypothetical protein [Gracilinema caldarium]|uniref:hypothetical protein n=1 Tax=Gracilinema caldarium TaxID=215591 RepID=UPI0026EE91BC|nr:hypothetical protein [Gracilinema caldarium]
MDSLFETLLTLIPLALILALRIAAARKEKLRLQEKTDVIESLKSKAVEPARAAKRAKVSHTVQSYKPAFNFEESAHPPIAQWDEKPQNRKGDGPIVSDVTYSSSETNDGPVTVMEHSAAPSQLKKDKVDELPGRPFHQLARLSTLQQAVVYAELLGPPKGLQ